MSDLRTVSELPEFIDYSGGKRLFGADHDKFRIDFAYDLGNCVRVVRLHGVKDLLGLLGQARVVHLRQNVQSTGLTLLRSASAIASRRPDLHMATTVVGLIGVLPNWPRQLRTFFTALHLHNRAVEKTAPEAGGSDCPGAFRVSPQSRG